MEIISTRPGDKNFELFTSLPSLIYPVDSPRLREKENINTHYLQSCYLLMDGNDIKSRLSLYLNPGIKYENKSCALIGNYESVEDPKYPEFLFNHVVQISKEMGIQFLIGPMNGSTWDNYRFTTDHDHPNFLLEPFHHLYYLEHFVRAGFEPISHYVSNIDRTTLRTPTENMNSAGLSVPSGVRLREIDLAHFDHELEKLYPLVIGSFNQNFLYSPITFETFREKYSAALGLIDPSLFLVTENDQKEITGFIFSYPDLLNPIEKGLVIKTIARNLAPEYAGLGRVLVNHLVQRAREKQFQHIIHAFMHVDARSIGLSHKHTGETYKEHVLFGKQL